MTAKRIAFHFRHVFQFYLFIYLVLASFLVAYLVDFYDLSYRALTPYLGQEEENLVFFDYYAYGTERRFSKGLTEDVIQSTQKLKENREGAVVKVPGKKASIICENYILVYDENVPDLNIEIYVAKNVNFWAMSLPFPTVVSLVERYSQIIVFWIIVFLLFFDLFFCFKEIVFHDIFLKKRMINLQ